MSKRISPAQKAVIVELAVLGLYGEGLEDAWDDEETFTIKTWSNHLVKSSLIKKSLVEVVVNEYGEQEIHLTQKGFEIALKEINQFDRPLDASNFYRFTRNYNRQF